MTVIYGEQFCEDLKEALKCESNQEFLGAFKGMMINEFKTENIDPNDLSIKIELDDQILCQT